MQNIARSAGFQHGAMELGTFQRAVLEAGAPINCRSASVTARHFPAGNSPSAKPPIFTRINRSVGCPTAAVMRRT